MTDAPTRTAIVTGGGRGIGAAIAARLAADGAGFVSGRSSTRRAASGRDWY